MAHHSLCVPLFHSLAELAKAVRIQREAQLLQLLHLQDLQLATLHRLLQALPKGLGNLLVLLALLPLDSFLAGYMGPEEVPLPSLLPRPALAQASGAFP